MTSKSQGSEPRCHNLDGLGHLVESATSNERASYSTTAAITTECRKSREAHTLQSKTDEIADTTIPDGNHQIGRETRPREEAGAESFDLALSGSPMRNQHAQEADIAEHSNTDIDAQVTPSRQSHETNTKGAPSRKRTAMEEHRDHNLQGLINGSSGGGERFDLLVGRSEKYECSASTGNIDLTLKMDSFLDLPAEVRNQVYCYLLEEEQDVEVVMRKQYTVSGTGSPWDPVVTRVRFLSTWSLTQASCQLRCEYLPLLRQARRVCVEMTLLHEYINAFHPADDPNEPDNRAGGEIKVIVDNNAFLESIDILALAKINDCSPELRIDSRGPPGECRHNIFQETDIMERIIRTYSQWCKIDGTSDMENIHFCSRKMRSNPDRYKALIEIKFGQSVNMQDTDQIKQTETWISMAGLVCTLFGGLTITSEIANHKHYWAIHNVWNRDGQPSGYSPTASVHHRDVDGSKMTVGEVQHD